MNVIPCLTWVKRGVAAAVPEKVELTPKELEDIITETRTELQDAETDSDQECSESTVNAYIKEQNNAVQNDPSNDDEYNFNKYDEENTTIHCSIANIVSFGKDGKDPLITAEENDEDSEKEDDIIKSNDNLILLCRVEEDACVLEVFVYNEEEGSLYCHHEILLSSFPLCVEWLNYDKTVPKPGNLCAVGTMKPVIEVWDLDLIDTLQPAYKLGSKGNKKKKKQTIGHKDAVLDIAWNQNYTHILASGSVDETVLLWDLENGIPATKLESFDEKVQSLKWHPVETHHLLTGCADKFVRLFDCREESNINNWQISGEVEKVLWNHFNMNCCIVSTDNGYIEYIDIRENKPIWQVSAHEKEVTGLSLSSACPGFLVSSSMDGIVKVWDIFDDKEPKIIWEQKSKQGALQSLASNPDQPFVFALSGDNKSHNFKVMDFSQISEVHDRFKERSFVRREEMMEMTEDMESMTFNTSS